MAHDIFPSFPRVKLALSYLFPIVFLINKLFVPTNKLQRIALSFLDFLLSTVLLSSMSSPHTTICVYQKNISLIFYIYRLLLLLI